MTTLEQVKIRLKQFHIDQDENGKDVVVFDRPEENPIIEQLIEQARKDVIAKRNYPNNYTKDMIEYDVNSFENVIVNLAVYDHSQAGEEFMSSYSENGISRKWKDRESLFVGVFPFVTSI